MQIFLLKNQMEKNANYPQSKDFWRLERSYKSKKRNIISSLDVSLSEGNINGITKFKLFIPSTRNGSSEVFMSLLMKEMGYLSPRTKIVKVSINDKNYEMIFQEKAVKEMLENNKLRESAILESDESLMWKIRSSGGPQ